MSEIKRYTLEQVTNFLNGEAELDGYYFGEHPPRKPYFWRKHLRQAMTDHLAAIQQAKIDAVREFAEKLKGYFYTDNLTSDKVMDIEDLETEIEQLKEQSND